MHDDDLTADDLGQLALPLAMHGSLGRHDAQRVAEVLRRLRKSWKAPPARQSWAPSTPRVFPPDTDETGPFAKLYWPPDTDEPVPLAVLLEPPDTDANCAFALLKAPPDTDVCCCPSAVLL